MIDAHRFIEIFQPNSKSRLGELSKYSRDLAHYTSASNALRILRSKKVTLRNASLMNDFSEIDHGEKCVLSGWRSHHGRGEGTQYAGRLFDLLTRVSPTIFPAVEQQYDRTLLQRKTDTFILSLSEHNEYLEGRVGRLSMWRAYGGRTNVALIINPGFLFDESVSGVYSSPVIYSSVADFSETYFKAMIDSVEEHFEEIAALDRDDLVHCLSLAINTMAMTTKHPGFAEEQEWRLIYAPWLYADQNVRSEVIEIGALPQKVHYIDLQSLKSSGGNNYSLNDLLQKIVVGPTENPWISYEAFVKELEDAGVSDAANKVIVSDIPIRR